MNESGLKLRVLLRTSTFQFAMMYALMFAVSVLVLFGILYWWTNRDLNRQIDAARKGDRPGSGQ